MRGNKRLVQGIAVAGAAGVLVCTVTFSQPQIMQTEETIQITEYGTELARTAFARLDAEDALVRQVIVEELRIDQVGNDGDVAGLSGDAPGIPGDLDVVLDVPAVRGTDENLLHFTYPFIHSGASR